MKNLFLDTKDPHLQIPSDLPPKYLFSIQNRNVFRMGLNFYNALTLMAGLKKKILERSYGTIHALLRIGLIRVIDDSIVDTIRTVLEKQSEGIYFYNAYVPSASKAIIQILNSSGSCQKVIKLAFDDKQKRSLEKEKDSLTYLKDFSFETFDIPRVINSYQIDRIFVVEYSCPEHYSSCGRFDVFPKLSELLLEMFSVGRQEELPLTESFLFKEIKERIELSGDDDLMRLMAILCKSLKTTMVPLGMVHYDVKPWNIVFDINTKRPFIVDWEFMRADGFPLWDAFCYILFTYFTLHCDSNPRASLGYFEQRRNFFEGYSRTLKIDLSLIKKLLPLYLLDLLTIRGIWNRWGINETRPHKIFTSMKRFLLYICDHPLGYV